MAPSIIIDQKNIDSQSIIPVGKACHKVNGHDHEPCDEKKSYNCQRKSQPPTVRVIHCRIIHVRKIWVTFVLRLSQSPDIKYPIKDALIKISCRVG